MTSISVAYFILRAGLGLNIFLHGIVRWKNGRKKFSDLLTRDFEKSFLPLPALKRFGLLLPIVETILGSLLLAGLFTQFSIITGTLLMLLLLMGKSLLQDWQTVSLQMIYIAFYSLLEWQLQYNYLSADNFFWYTNRQTCLYIFN
jgi:thiosulfate dehydrogenase [quinone] large subunit